LKKGVKMWQKRKIMDSSQGTVRLWQRYKNLHASVLNLVIRFAHNKNLPCSLQSRTLLFALLIIRACLAVCKAEPWRSQGFALLG